MNDKWFNIAMIIVFTSLVANGFVFMLTSFPHDSTFDPNELHLTQLDYNGSGAMKQSYAYNFDKNASMSPSATNVDGSGFTPFTFLTEGLPYGLAPLNVLIIGFVGLELLLLQLAEVFSVFAVLFGMIVLVMFTVKVIVIAYFASVLIRMLFGGRS